MSYKFVFLLCLSIYILVKVAYIVTSIQEQPRGRAGHIHPRVRSESKKLVPIHQDTVVVFHPPNIFLFLAGNQLNEL